jgi:hypothetical protein
MLKATIIYLPGSAGSMLYKTLTLSEKTITGTKGQDLEEYNKKLTAQEKFSRYITWDSTDWKTQERKDLLGYVNGRIDFHHYEESDLWTIDSWHPLEFHNQYTQKTLWGEKFYENVISIQVGPEHKEFLLANQTAKRYSLDFDKEYQCLNILCGIFGNILLTIPFDSFFNKIQYLDQISKLDTELYLELNLDLVEDLWEHWFKESLLIWKK